MQQDNTKELELRMNVKYEKIKHLILAAYYMGQEAGLCGKTYNNPECQESRQFLVDLILKEIK
jgi:hypothetical protein